MWHRITHQNYMHDCYTMNVCLCISENKQNRENYSKVSLRLFILESLSSFK